MVIGAGALAALLDAGVAIPVTEVGAPATGGAALAGDIAVDLTCAGNCVVPDTAGVADSVDVADAVGVAALLGEATELAAVDSADVAVPVAGAWLSGDAVG